MRSVGAGASALEESGLPRQFVVPSDPELASRQAAFFPWHSKVPSCGEVWPVALHSDPATGNPVWCNKAAEVGESAKQGRCERLLPQ